ncbi:ABC transporter substrate-binding protein [Mycolicibacterium smegmatis]|nr:ABC transporter substrate-binding protein [Mycolicibacterium smegmatis]
MPLPEGATVNKSMQRLARSAVACCVAGALVSGCSSAPGDTSQETDGAKPSGQEITVATDATYRPFETVDTATKKIVGLDADLVEAIGDTLGLTVKLTNVGFDSIVPGLQARKYDAAASGISVTPEREKVVDFVPYMSAGSGLAVQKGNPHDLKMEPLALCGHTIGAPKGTIQAIGQLPEISAKCVAEGKPEISISQFPSQDAVNLALSSGRIDAAMAAKISLAIQVEESDGALELAPGDPYDPSPVGIAFPKGSDLLPAVKTAMAQLDSSGELKKIVTKWGMPENSIYTGAP